MKEISSLEPQHGGVFYFYGQALHAENSRETLKNQPVSAMHPCEAGASN
jgi:hypothetical protein